MKRMCVSKFNFLYSRPLQWGRSLLTGLVIVMVGLWIALFGAIAPASAANPDHVTQLLETNACVGCDLEEADLRGFNLRDSNLESANLKGAYLMATNLRHANLRNAKLDAARMYTAILTDADLTGSSADAAYISGATICHTRIPSGKLSNRDCDNYSG